MKTITNSSKHSPLLSVSSVKILTLQNLLCILISFCCVGCVATGKKTLPLTESNPSPRISRGERVAILVPVRKIATRITMEVNARESSIEGVDKGSITYNAYKAISSDPALHKLAKKLGADVCYFAEDFSIADTIAKKNDFRIDYFGSAIASSFKTFENISVSNGEMQFSKPVGDCAKGARIYERNKLPKNYSKFIVTSASSEGPSGGYEFLRYYCLVFPLTSTNTYTPCISIVDSSNRVLKEYKQTTVRHEMTWYPFIVTFGLLASPIDTEKTYASFVEEAGNKIMNDSR